MNMFVTFLLLTVLWEEPGRVDAGDQMKTRRQTSVTVGQLELSQNTGSAGNRCSVLSAESPGAVSHLLSVCVPQDLQHVNVMEGEDSVVLPCQVNVSNTSVVVWSRNKSGIVHVHPWDRDSLDHQDQRYKNRTQMHPDALQSGNLSLTLLKPTTNDSDLYKCNVREYGKDLSERKVQLKVTG